MQLLLSLCQEHLARICAVGPNGTGSDFPVGVPPLDVHEASTRYDG
jgi:hypothetical protein